MRKSSSRITPPLRWAGGKQRWVKKLASFLPSNLSGVYHEPFLGAGSLFFFMRPRTAFLSDANKHLIECYRFIRDRPDLIHRYLSGHASLSSRQHYYEVRELYNGASTSASQAARFIYLNKACFHGVFRVNTNGEFNVPYGWSEPPAIPTLSTLREASSALKKASLRVCGFDRAMTQVRPGDFVYLDPPFPPLNGTSFFRHYTIDRFSTENQERLAEVVHRLNAEHVLVMMSNADTKSIRRLYRGFNISALPTVRWVSLKKTKHLVKELIITNYG